MKKFFSRSAQTTTLFLVVVGILALALGGYFSFASSGFNNLLVTTQSWISSRFLAVQDFLTVPRDVIALRQQNASLQANVSRLQAKVVQLQQQVSEISRVPTLIIPILLPR